MKDYQRIEHAIDYLRDFAHQQPSLDQVAEQVHLSPYHFQRLFSRFAGVSPKRFLQSLTLEEAKTRLLTSTDSLLEVSEQLGLSSSSRLHEHFVQIQAVTPGEFRSGGEGLSIDYGWADSPFGSVFMAATERGICQLSFVDPDRQGDELAQLQQQWPKANCRQSAAKIADLAERVFFHASAEQPVSLWLKGSNFQLSVWRALLKIPEGAAVSYGGLAKAIGKPRAAQAVGQAVGANPVALLIPCHRVIRRDGQLGGYRWGETRKQLLLGREWSGTGPAKTD